MNKIKLFVIIFFFGLVSAVAQNKLYAKYKVTEGETIRSVCKKLSITPYRLITLNPEIKDNDTLDGVTILIVPNKEYTPVSDSGEHIDYVKDGFLYHKLLPKETYSKLKREYKVSKRQLRHYNTDLRFGGLKAGQIIKIPVSSDFKLPSNIENISETVTDKNTKPYIVKPKETKHSISRRYGISIEQLEELNPLIKEAGLKAESIILVPNTEAIPDDTSEMVMYTVKKSEGIFRITQNFGVTKEALLALNPEIKDGLKEGMRIKIPLTTTNIISTTQFEPSVIPDKELNVVFMLPFMSTGKTIDFETTGVDKTADIATDYYLGASLALDSLKQLGVSVNVKTFDTQNSKVRISSIFTALDLSNVDVIIGPMFYNNLELVSQLTRGKNIPIISPVSRRDHAPIGNGVLIQEMPPKDALSEKILSYIKDTYNGQNLVVIGDDKKESEPVISAITAKLEVLDSINTVTVIKPEKGYIKRALFLEKIIENKDNIIVLATDDEIVTTDVINNLGSLPEKLKTTLFTLYKGDNFDDSKDINNQLAHVNFHYPEYNFVDAEQLEAKNFIAKYKRINFTTPSEYAFKGFDTTYDVLLRLASFNDITSALAAGSSQRTSTKFNYKKNATNSGFINNGVYIVKYDGLNLVKVD